MQKKLPTLAGRRVGLLNNFTNTFSQDRTDNRTVYMLIGPPSSVDGVGHVKTRVPSVTSQTSTEAQTSLILRENA